jgi:hypothetical protein
VALQRGSTPAGGPLPLAQLPHLTSLLHWGALEALLEAGEAAGLLKRSAGGSGAASGRCGGGEEEVRVELLLLRRLEAGSAEGAAVQEARRAARAALGLPAGRRGPLPDAGTDAWALLQRRLAGFAAWWLSQQAGECATRTELQNRLQRLCGSWTRAGAVVELLLERRVAEEEQGEGEGGDAQVVLL